ncbi:MAG: hypothetical protein CMF28_04790 [Kiritimatiellaceae bacterium]|nr:hypothetical protein [Kiritimatiellaceae bacterium]
MRFEDGLGVAWRGRCFEDGLGLFKKRFVGFHVGTELFGDLFEELFEGGGALVGGSGGRWFLTRWGGRTASGGRCFFGTAALNGGLDQIDQGDADKDEKWNEIIHADYSSAFSSSLLASDSRMEVSAMMFCMR